jgi:4-hydroxy-tetrahydrodipicolinate synthase
MLSLGGIITAMVTPFDSDGRLAEDKAVSLMDHLTRNGSNGLVLCGTTGEGATLTDAEMYRMWQLGVEEADATIIAATGTNDTAHSVERTQRATELGADAMLVVCPYYNKPSPRGIVSHFEAIARATDRPIIVYNIPSRCGVDISNELLRELAEIENVTAVKQARFQDIEPVDGMDLLAGNDEVLCEVLDKGGSGGVLVASHIVGSEMRRMMEEPAQRHEIHNSLTELFKALTIASNPAPIKTALNMLGYEVGGLRLPLVEPTESEGAQIHKALETHGLLSAV